MNCKQLTNSNKIKAHKGYNKTTAQSRFSGYLPVKIRIFLEIGIPKADRRGKKHVHSPPGKWLDLASLVPKATLFNAFMNNALLVLEGVKHG